MKYQDLVDDQGNSIEKGYRECETRYEVIRRVAEELRRPFTVLDLGASSGYFSIRLTQDFGARAIAVDPNPSVMDAEGRVAAVMQCKMDIESLLRMGTYDIVLALSVLHHMDSWRKVLRMINSMARSALIVETPNPREKLKQALNRKELKEIDEACRLGGMKKEGVGSGVWNNDLDRPLYVLRRNGLPVRGEVFSGSGSNGVHTSRLAKELEPVLGYTPFPGSLNLRTKYAFKLGAYATEFVDERRGKGGRKGGDYQIWHATVEGFDGPAHVIRPGVRNHGRYGLEIWAPVGLREHLGLTDGSSVTVRIGA